MESVNTDNLLFVICLAQAQMKHTSPTQAKWDVEKSSDHKKKSLSH